MGRFVRINSMTTKLLDIMKYKMPFILLTAGLMLLSVQSCKSMEAEAVAQNNDITKKVEIKNSFRGVSASSAFDISYTVNNSSPVAVMEGPKELITDAVVEVQNGLLTFSLKNNVSRRTISKRITVTLNGPSLSIYKMSASATITVLSYISNKENMDIDVSSAGEVTFRKDVTTQGNINISGSSSGEVTFLNMKAAKDMDVKLSSSASFNGNTVSVSDLTASCSSSAEIEIALLNSKTGNFTSSSGADIKITKMITPKVRLNSSSAGDIKIESLEASGINAVSSSGGDIKIWTAKSDAANLVTSSGGFVKVGGNIKTVAASASSGGDIDIRGVKSSNKSKSKSSGGRIVD